MKIECHVLQNFAPSCLNRDDTNTPKDCEFGGSRRARVSSQSWKKSIRDFFRAEGSVPFGERTKYLESLIMPRLADMDEPEDLRAAMVEVFLSAFYSKMDGDTGKTKVLLFISQPEIQEIAAIIQELREPLGKAGAARIKQLVKLKASRKSQQDDDPDTRGTEKDDKEASLKIDGSLRDKIVERLSAPSADIALFGRMLAEQPGRNTDAACQVAHAFSTHAVNMEMDFYTAVDDLTKDRDETGAGMLGTQGFNSACFYRYALLDTDQLQKNLGGDLAAAQTAVEAFLNAFCLAIPTAKQNSHAAQNLPSFGLFVVRDNGVPVSLANAFAQPIRRDDIIAESVSRLAHYYERLNTVYHLYDGATVALFHDRETDKPLGELASQDAGSLAAAVEAVMARVKS